MKEEVVKHPMLISIMGNICMVINNKFSSRIMEVEKLFISCRCRRKNWISKRRFYSLNKKNLKGTESERRRNCTCKNKS